MNHKRVERLWRREGLTDGSCVRCRPAYRLHVWAYDFLTARTHDGRPLKILTVVEEYSRECLAIVVARQLRSTEVLETLAELFVTHGLPAHIRSACYEQVVKALGAVGPSNRGTDTGSGSVEPAHRASSGLIPEERRVPGGSTSSCLRREELRTTVGMASCRSRIRHQAAAGSWTMPRQWEIQRTWLNSARAAVRSPAKPNGV